MITPFVPRIFLSVMYIYFQDCICIASIYGAHHDTSLWKDPHSFIPERHLDKNGNLDKKDRTIGFGAGEFFKLYFLFPPSVHPSLELSTYKHFYNQIYLTSKNIRIVYLSEQTVIYYTFLVKRSNFFEKRTFWFLI